MGWWSYYALLFVLLSLGAMTARAQNLYVAELDIGTVSMITPGGVVTPFVTGLNFPTSLSFDASGNMYESDNETDSVNKITPGGTVTLFAAFPGGSNPYDSAVDSSGNLFVNLNAANEIDKVTPSGVISTFLTGTGETSQLVIDPSNNLYLPDGTFNNIDKVTPGGVETTFATGISGAMGFNGNILYVANNTGIYEISPAGVVTTFLLGDYSGGENLAFDSSGNLYYSNFSTGDVYEVTTGGVSSVFASGLSQPLGVAFAPPIPEPGSVAMLVGGLGMLGLVVGRRRAS